MTTSFALTVVALLLESVEKSKSSATEKKSQWKSRAPEQRSGLWARTCFTWLASTFWLGYTKIISVDDLPALDTKLESWELGEKLIELWDKCKCGRTILFEMATNFNAR
jgi:ATP-binding cassette subfamily C (CFTR/MRP) protein 1